MDWTVLAASLVTGLLGIGAINTLVKNVMPKIARWSALAKDAVSALEDVSQSLSDGNLTPEETARLIQDVSNLKSELTALLHS